MTKRKWKFISNHGRIFAFIAKHPQTTTLAMANKVGLSIGAVQNIMDDLEAEGYLTRERVGRGNQYHISLEKPLRHHLEKHTKVSDLLSILNIVAKERH